MTKIAPLKVGINGFGRIGRAITRILLERNHHAIVHINDLNTDIANVAYLLKYDTIYGRLASPVSHTETDLLFPQCPARVTHEKNIAAVDWKASGVDVVIEATGVHQNELDARNLTQNGTPVLVTHTAPSADFTLIYGVTDTEFDPSKHQLVSTSICDTNACAPTLKALDDAFTLSHGFITSLHPWLAYQNLMDGPSRSQSYPGVTYSHYPLGRSSIGCLIPKPTTLVSACERVLPHIRGRIHGMSYRVPTPVVSSADLTLTFKKTFKREDVLDVLKQAQVQQENPRVFRITDEPLISVDYLGDEHSAIIDTRWLAVNNGDQLKLVLWYDNEWGYSARVADALDLIVRRKR